MYMNKASDHCYRYYLITVVVSSFLLCALGIGVYIGNFKKENIVNYDPSLSNSDTGQGLNRPVEGWFGYNKPIKTTQHTYKHVVFDDSDGDLERYLQPVVVTEASFLNENVGSVFRDDKLSDDDQVKVLENLKKLQGQVPKLPDTTISITSATEANSKISSTPILKPPTAEAPNQNFEFVKFKPKTTPNPKFSSSPTSVTTTTTTTPPDLIPLDAHRNFYGNNMQDLLQNLPNYYEGVPQLQIITDEDLDYYGVYKPEEIDILDMGQPDRQGSDNMQMDSDYDSMMRDQGFESSGNVEISSDFVKVSGQ